MIFIWSMVIGGLLSLLPWWTSIVLGIIIGYAFRVTWIDALKFAAPLAALIICLSVYYDIESSQIITNRTSALVQLPAVLLYIFPGLVYGWFSFFGARFGGALRDLLF